MISSGDPADVVYADVLADLAEERREALDHRHAELVAAAVWGSVKFK